MGDQPYEWPPNTYSQKKKDIATVLWTLHLDGPFESSMGKATGMMVDALARRGLQIALANLNKTLNDLTRGGRFAYDDFDYVVRNMNGKRTYSIALAVDPAEVPFPDCPFRDRTPLSRSASTKAPLKGLAGMDVLDRVKALSRSEQTLEPEFDGDDGDDGLVGEDELPEAATDQEEAVNADIDERFDDEPATETPRPVAPLGHGSTHERLLQAMALLYDVLDEVGRVDELEAKVVRLGEQVKGLQRLQAARTKTRA